MSVRDDDATFPRRTPTDRAVHRKEARGGIEIDVTKLLIKLQRYETIEYASRHHGGIIEYVLL